MAGSFSNFSESVPSGFLRRKDFRSDFLFGSSTSAFQIEGGHDRDGRRPNIFDSFAHDRNLFHPYGEDAVNHREHYQEDVKLMKQMGFNAYRFSIQWSRILPTGKLESRSQDGINFYKDLLLKLRKEEIEPLATLLHFDPPQDLEDQYFTFLSREIVDDFRVFADICFQEFGDYVKYWTTINEPWYVSYGGYITGDLPPAYETDQNYIAIQKEEAKKSGKNIPYDDEHSSICPPMRSSIKSRSSPSSSSARRTPKNAPLTLPSPEHWPYITGYYQLLAHAEAVKLYRENYQHQGGKIGLNMVAQGYVPLEDTPENREAAERALDFMLGWFMEPLYSGDYPERMRKSVTAGHLPKFSDQEKQMIRGSYDFVSLNYYTSLYVTHEETKGGDYVLDRRVRFHDEKDGVPIGNVKGYAGWINGYPRGLLQVLVHIKEKYGDPDIHITENGFDDEDDDSMTHWNSFHDQNRILYLHDHLAYVKEAIRRGVKVKGHFVWSFLDNLELGLGFKSRFGITYVDYDDENSRRIPKLSAAWYKNFLTKNE